MIAAIVEGVMQAIEEGDHKTTLATMCQQRSRQKQHKGKQIYCIQENSLFWKKRALGDVQTHETLFSKLAVYELCYIYLGNSAGKGTTRYKTRQDKPQTTLLWHSSYTPLSHCFPALFVHPLTLTLNCALILCVKLTCTLTVHCQWIQWCSQVQLLR